MGLPSWAGVSFSERLPLCASPLRTPVSLACLRKNAHPDPMGRGYEAVSMLEIDNIQDTPGLKRGWIPMRMRHHDIVFELDVMIAELFVKDFVYFFCF